MTRAVEILSVVLVATLILLGVTLKSCSDYKNAPAKTVTKGSTVYVNDSTGKAAMYLAGYTDGLANVKIVTKVKTNSYPVYVFDSTSSARADSLEDALHVFMERHDEYRNLIATASIEENNVHADLYFSYWNRSFAGSRFACVENEMNAPAAVEQSFFDHFGYGLHLGTGLMYNGTLHAGVVVSFGINYNF